MSRRVVYLSEGTALRFYGLDMRIEKALFSAKDPNKNLTFELSTVTKSCLSQQVVVVLCEFSFVVVNCMVDLLSFLFDVNPRLLRVVNPG